MNTQLLNRHLDLVIEANGTTNITRITNIEEARLLHIEDSLSGLPYINAAPDGLYGDMGSGAGFPGIPLAIESLRETVLIESVSKKGRILESFVHELQLQNVRVFSGRVEELSLQSPASFSVLTARALSKLGSLLELASPLLKKDGLLVCYKGTPDYEEISHAQNLCSLLGFEPLATDSFLLSDYNTSRTLVVFKKVNNASIKLPRHVGFAQKKPL